MKEHPSTCCWARHIAEEANETHVFAQRAQPFAFVQRDRSAGLSKALQFDVHPGQVAELALFELMHEEVLLQKEH